MTVLNPIAEILSEYLRKAIYDPKEAILNIAELPEDFQNLGMYMRLFAAHVNKTKELIELKKESLAQSNSVLNALIGLIPLQIIVFKRSTKEILLLNHAAKKEMEKKEDYFPTLLSLLALKDDRGNGLDMHIEYPFYDSCRYFTVKSYFMSWGENDAEVLILSDESEANYKIKALEEGVYRDSMTGLYNRTYGMNLLKRWLSEKKCFTLIFADLDFLKYVNDEYGHTEGDIYIINTAKHLRTVSPSAIVCRLGGNEFMLLLPDTCYEAAHTSMSRVCLSLTVDEYVLDKKYSYSISFGVIEIDADNTLTSKEILLSVDERMYENKRMKKKQRVHDLKMRS